MKDTCVLVVGGAGYIGSHMVKKLLDNGHAVVVLDDLSTGHRDLVAGGVMVEGRLGDRALLDKVFEAHRIDAVMHFAASSLVAESVGDPLKYYRNNIAETIALLEAMVAHRVGRFIFSSTAAVYGEPMAVPITEEHPLKPANPYGVTKVAIERMLADCRKAYGIRSIVLRYFNAAGADPEGRRGERHNPESHLIPIVLQAAAGRREHISIFGCDYDTPDGTCVRDYIHVNDLADAHLLALEALVAGAENVVYNLGNSRGHSVREVIRTAERVTGRTIAVQESERRPGDPAILVASSARIAAELGYKPKIGSLEEIIRSAWNWHRAEEHRGDHQA